MARNTSLATYQAKRDFTRTAEPAPGAAANRANAPIFVVQKHAARRAGLHWDFRLEHGGVLWSWAVPRGPSLDPAHKRMAIHVEDHPLDYAAFEGTIPAGSYGAGAVTLWDRGTWQPLGDPEQGMKDGELRFTLDGARLHGRFTLVRLRRRDPRKAEAWFLIKATTRNSARGSMRGAGDVGAAGRRRGACRAARPRRGARHPAARPVTPAVPRRRGPARGRRMNQRAQVRRLSPAGLEDSGWRAPRDAQRP